MINRICEHISDFLIKKGMITDKDRHIYSYLFSCIFEELLFDFITLLIGGIFHKLIISTLFLVTTLPLRYFAGGVHASTPLRCNILSYGIMLFVIFFPYTTFSNANLFEYIIFFTCSVIILVIAPVDTANKRLNEKDKCRLHKKTVITVIFVCIVQLILWYNKLTQYSETITLSFLVCTISLITGYIRNMIYDSKEH